MFWCPRRDLNPHTFRHKNLNLACLPIPPLGLFISMVHREGLEPSRLSAMVFETIVSANSTTSAIQATHIFLSSTITNCEKYPMVHKAGLEPARPLVWSLAPQASASANSATRALLMSTWALILLSSHDIFGGA